MFSRWSLENTNSFCFQIPRWTYAHVALLWFVPSIKRLKFAPKTVFVFPAWPPSFTNNFHAHTLTPPCKRKKIICSQWLFPPFFSNIKILCVCAYFKFKLYRFSSDTRLSPLHEPGSRDYNLRFSNVTPADSAVYQCHVGTRPEQIARVKLSVIGKAVEEWFEESEWDGVSLT